MKDILAEICKDKLEHIKYRKNMISLEELEKNISTNNPFPFIENIKKSIQDQGNAIIAEVKKASPSKGVIRADFDHVQIAKSYENAGAAAISVLTDEKYFQGADIYLREIREQVKLPLLRKDFMLDNYQIAEAKYLGANCILLIMAAISNQQAKELEDAAISYGLDILVEVHDEIELERALKHLRSKMIGVNNRNLKTLEIDLNISIKLSSIIPDDYLKICESGVYSKDDIKMMNDVGINAFLIGESLMRQVDIEHALRTLI